MLNTGCFKNAGCFEMWYARGVDQKTEPSYTVQLGTSWRLTLPLELRHKFDFQVGDVFVLTAKEDGRLELRSGKDVAQKTRGVLKTMKPKKRGKREKGA
jgi:bifunctional DNA-binding transcriptional regulator/antitoxin component of YhaV-PrlF toxin-antitoxin module